MRRLIYRRLFELERYGNYRDWTSFSTSTLEIVYGYTKLEEVIVNFPHEIPQDQYIDVFKDCPEFRQAFSATKVVWREKIGMFPHDL